MAGGQKNPNEAQGAKKALCWEGFFDPHQVPTKPPAGDQKNTQSKKKHSSLKYTQGIHEKVRSKLFDLSPQTPKSAMNIRLNHRLPEHRTWKINLG